MFIFNPQEGDSAGAVEAPEKPLPPKPGKPKTSSGLVNKYLAYTLYIYVCICIFTF